MTNKVIAEPTGKLCSENPCQCKCWCKAEWHIRYEEGGEFDYKGCAGMASHASGTKFPATGTLRGKAAARAAHLLLLFRCLEKQQPKRWSFPHREKLIPLPEYWSRGAGEALLREKCGGVMPHRLADRGDDFPSES